MLKPWNHSPIRLQGMSRKKNSVTLMWAEKNSGPLLLRHISPSPICLMPALYRHWPIAQVADSVARQWCIEFLHAEIPVFTPLACRHDARHVELMLRCTRAPDSKSLFISRLLHLQRSTELANRALSLPICVWSDRFYTVRKLYSFLLLAGIAFHNLLLFRHFWNWRKYCNDFRNTYK